MLIFCALELANAGHQLRLPFLFRCVPGCRAVQRQKPHSGKIHTCYDKNMNYKTSALLRVAQAQSSGSTNDTGEFPMILIRFLTHCI
ncbi:hypothetical protein HDF12_004128 [Edaphobacter lichenicola]|uniref:Uncharacterized protein n=1 Tax=Tunturiibacter lichenicola TaxID=2051959 RepID=A0A7Y9T6V0_9BACT|nr:hypothetical protein [Edaphobacter lichenicola]